MDYKQIQYDRFLQAKMDALRLVERLDVAMNAIREDSWGKAKHVGAAKRASMDLTRSLVFVRKSPFSE